MTIDGIRGCVAILKKRAQEQKEYVIIMHPNEFKRECAIGGRLHGVEITETENGYIIQGQLIMLSKRIPEEGTKNDNT